MTPTGASRIGGFKRESWKPEDCRNRLAAYSMMGNASAELAHAQAVSLLGPEHCFTSTRRHTSKRHLGLILRASHRSCSLMWSAVMSVFPSRRRGYTRANNWTVSRALTDGGKPLPANDPHRLIAEPSLRYIVHLHAPGWSVIGAGLQVLPSGSRARPRQQQGSVVAYFKSKC